VAGASSTTPGRYRASKVIGSDVLNDANQSIGKIDDLLVNPDGTAPFAVLSIGGSLGRDTHLVVVPYDNLKLVGNKIVLPGGTKDTLKMLPEFKYAVKKCTYLFGTRTAGEVHLTEWAPLTERLAKVHC
jgi:sporulation protein YlmC with PRC-barrel domain